ncbi:MAG: arginine--tRNA ligase [Rhodospirillales bacterium]|jgi:arginyl-tRNA synthetase|nr:arginine--tRNA ligase [Rhodospirillales bacterium]
MNLFDYFRGRVIEAIDHMAEGGDLPAGTETHRIVVEPPRDATLGDVTTNAAMVLAKTVGLKPRDLAEQLAARLAALDEVATVEIAGPGFINMRLSDGFWLARLVEILQAGPGYGASKVGGGVAVNVEYVSANPTGPLHVGHARGAVVGDALAALLEKAGFAVTREYYINDAGAQVEALAWSAYYRYLQVLGAEMDEAAFAKLCPGGELQYRGEYLIPLGEALVETFGDSLADRDGVHAEWTVKPIDAWLPTVRQFAIDRMMDLVREDLAALGVRHAVFTSEQELVARGGVDEALAFFAERQLTYTGVLEPPKGKLPDDWEPRPQLLFKATAFGDDVDRPLKKSDGSWTYFATDVANHLDKYRRGFGNMINVWGADHGGYVKRMQAAVKAITEGKGSLDVKLCQMVNLLDGGQPVKMSKRAGTFVTLRDVVDEVGKDVVRFIMLTRKNDAHLDFDLKKVTEQSRDNPVFYVQYAHARIRSVMRKALEIFEPREVTPAFLATADLRRLTDPEELALIRTMAGWPRIVESAAEAHEPHRVAYYLYDLAAQFHTLWNKGNDDASLRFLVPEERALTLARLAMIQGVAFVIASGLDVFGVTPVEEMR